MMGSRIQVNYRDGSPASNTRVSLGFSGGVTESAYTDHTGMAVVSHSSSGQATVYVDGMDRGYFSAPGFTAVTIIS